MKKLTFTPLEIRPSLLRASVFLTGFIIVISIILPLEISQLSDHLYPKERLFLIEEKILVKNLPSDLNELRVWVPYPVSDNWQAIEDFKLAGPFKVDVILDKEYGNRIILLKLKKDVTYNMPLQITLSFMAKRRENSTSGNLWYGISKNRNSNHRKSLWEPSPSGDKSYREAIFLETSSKNLSRFLGADRLVPVNGEIKKLAEEMTQGKSNDMEKARAIYDYLIDEITYSKDDPKVCGIGDSLLTLQYKKGICTDYHSLFISLVRSLGIPAKFEIGFRIPKEPQEGKLNGYHCWALVYIKGKGWIPVDISEADKNPEKRDYYFGNIDEDRIRLTAGRDIILKEANDLESLNFFVYPYAELNGLQFNDMDIEISYKTLSRM